MTLHSSHSLDPRFPVPLQAQYAARRKAWYRDLQTRAAQAQQRLALAAPAIVPELPKWTTPKIQLERSVLVYDPLAYQFAEAKSQIRHAKIPAFIRGVAKYYRLTATDLTGARRHLCFTNPRQVAMYIMRLAGFSFTQIGAALNRDHSTVVNAFQKIERRIAIDHSFAADVGALWAFCGVSEA
jgi:hypothetical protein